MSDQKGKDQTATNQKRKASRRRGKRKPLRQYHVILHDDNDHTHEYVIEMLKALLAIQEHQGMRLAKQVDEEGRAVILTTHLEKAELKRDQVHAYGTDHRVATCCGSMSASIMPAPD